MTRTLWLFTDGGATMRGDKTFYGSFGFAIFEEIHNSFVRVSAGGGYEPHTTVPRMEFEGGIKGLETLEGLITEDDGRCELYIVMDALNTVESINAWHRNWMKQSTPDGTWMRKDIKTKRMEPVLNQDLLKVLISGVNKLKLQHYVKVMHINSHIERKGFNECYKYFMDKNNMILTKEGFQTLIRCNEIVDKIVIDTRRKHHVA